MDPHRCRTYASSFFPGCPPSLDALTPFYTILVTLPSKVGAEHLRRRAYLYVRQSTMRQLSENTESTARQYDLRRRAVALGWGEEQIEVIDSDLGQSAASAADRVGFQRLVSEVGLGHAGIVMGLEVSRLARNSNDWHRLLEICALARTLILDEDGLYDPASVFDVGRQRPFEHLSQCQGDVEDQEHDRPVD